MSLKNLAVQMRKEQAAANITPEEKFIAEIEKFLVERPAEKRDGGCFTSTTYQKCQRWVWYKLRGMKEQKKVYPRSVRITDIGTKTHDWIQDTLKSMSDNGYKVKLLPVEEFPNYGKEGVKFIQGGGNHPIETKMKDSRWTEKYIINTMCDGSLEFENRQMLFEFKTINTDDFKVLIEPLKKHVKQGAMYALITGIMRVMFLYINKNDQHLKAYLVEYTDEQLEWVKNRLRYIERCLLDNVLPEKEGTEDECHWCGYRHLCIKEGNHFKIKSPA